MDEKWTRQGGKDVPGGSVAKEIAKYINKKHGVSVSAYADAFGEIDTILWFVDYADLGSIEKLRSELILDREYIRKFLRHSDARPLNSREREGSGHSGFSPCHECEHLNR
jgi:hypothetical protein